MNPDDQFELRRVIFGQPGTGPSERRNVDYKGLEPWPSDKSGQAKLTRDIAALANWEGGWLVWGVVDKLNTVVGVSDEVAKTFDSTKINRYVNNHVTPPINTTVYTPEFDGMRFVVLEVKAFNDVPHIFVKPFEGQFNQADIFVRSAANNSERVQSVEDLRAILDRAVRNRADLLLGQIRGLLTPQMSPTFEVAPWYADRLNEFNQRAQSELTNAIENGVATRDQPLWTISGHLQTPSTPKDAETLQQACHNASIKRGGARFLYVEYGTCEYRSWGIICRLNRTLNSAWPHFDFWQLDGSGLFQHFQNMGPASPPKSYPASKFLRLIVTSLETVGLIFQQLYGPTAILTVRCEISNADDLSLTTGDMPVHGGSPTCREPNLTWETTGTVQDLVTGVADHSALAFKTFRRAFGPTSSSETENIKRIEEFLAGNREL